MSPEGNRNDSHEELCNACYYGDVEAVKRIISADKVDVNYHPPGVASALECACGCRYPSLEIAEILLKNGADPNIKGRNGHTPLQLAAVSNSIELVKMLLDHGAIDVPDDAGDTALDIARKCGFDIIAKMIEHSI